VSVGAIGSGTVSGEYWKDRSVRQHRGAHLAAPRWVHAGIRDHGAAQNTKIRDFVLGKFRVEQGESARLTWGT